jgi:hypothetical protein
MEGGVLEARGDIEWDFRAPRQPYRTEFYACLLAVVELTLHHCYNPASPVLWDFFNTTLVVLEGILNSRPLSYKTKENGELAPLSPADFLGTPPYRQLAEPPPKGWNLRKRWHQLQEQQDKLWNRLQREIQPYLQKMTRWRKRTRELRAADVVTYLDERRRGRWPLGRIVDVGVGRDGAARKVVVCVDGIEHVKKVERIMLLLSPEDEERLRGEEAEEEDRGDDERSGVLRRVAEQSEDGDEEDEESGCEWKYLTGEI